MLGSTGVLAPGPSPLTPPSVQVRAPHVQWHEAKRSMKRDPRWEATKLLDYDEKEQIFQGHVLELANKKRLQFRRLLEETGQVGTERPLPFP